MRALACPTLRLFQFEDFRVRAQAAFAALAIRSLFELADIRVDRFLYFLFVHSFVRSFFRPSPLHFELETFNLCNLRPLGRARRSRKSWARYIYIYIYSFPSAF